MLPCHCQCQLDHHTVLQNKIHANIETSCICVQGLFGLGMSLEFVTIRDSSHTHTFIKINALLAL